MSSNYWLYSFLYLKYVKIHFHGVPHLVHSGLQNTWILEVVIPFYSGNMYIKESKKAAFIFSIELRTKFVWSHGWSHLASLYCTDCITLTRFEEDLYLEQLVFTGASSSFNPIFWSAKSAHVLGPTPSFWLFDPQFFVLSPGSWILGSSPGSLVLVSVSWNLGPRLTGIT